MGEVAEMILDGILDEQTGEYLGEAVGYPRTMHSKNYQNVKTKPRKKVNLGGQHLIGKSFDTKNNGQCLIKDCLGKRGKRRYVCIDKEGNEHKLKFSQLIFKK